MDRARAIEIFSGYIASCFPEYAEDVRAVFKALA